MALKASAVEIEDAKISDMIVAAIDEYQRTHYVFFSPGFSLKRIVAILGRIPFCRLSRYVRNIAKTNKRVLFGVPVRPYREKNAMLAKVRDYMDNNMVLLKWMPSIHQIDYENDNCKPFYELLAKKKVPLFRHTAHQLAVLIINMIKYSQTNNLQMLAHISAFCRLTRGTHAEKLIIHQ